MLGAVRERFDLVVLGSGPAGEKAATQAAYYGKRVAVAHPRAARAHDRGRHPEPGAHTEAYEYAAYDGLQLLEKR
jgi:thioredoxin reductase